jgi:uncharacterized membrane protein (DUF106 family)
MGSKTSPRAGAPRPDMGGQLVMLMAFMIAILIMFNNDLRQGLGHIIGYGLFPLIGFNAQMPVITLILTGLTMTFFSVTVRHLFVNWVEQAKSQRIMSAFQKEMKEARQSNNTYKLKKLTEIQPEMMAQSMKASGAQLKLMPVTMIVIIPIFAWLSNFVYIDLASTSFSVPWELNSDMRNSNILPNWILLYSLVTIPFGQVLQRGLKYFSFMRRLNMLEERGVEGASG